MFDWLRPQEKEEEITKRRRRMDLSIYYALLKDWRAVDLNKAKENLDKSFEFLWNIGHGSYNEEDDQFYNLTATFEDFDDDDLIEFKQELLFVMLQCYVKDPDAYDKTFRKFPMTESTDEVSIEHAYHRIVGMWYEECMNDILEEMRLRVREAGYVKRFEDKNNEV